MQARESIKEAEVIMGLLDVQSQLGLSHQGPLAPQSLAEAALQVLQRLTPALKSLTGICHAKVTIHAPPYSCD